jgi:hypothetical protein
MQGHVQTEILRGDVTITANLTAAEEMSYGGDAPRRRCTGNLLGSLSTITDGCLEMSHGGDALATSSEVY